MGALLSLLVLPLAASAQPKPHDSVAVCTQAHHDAQVARQNGKLLRARELLVACSQSSCPSLVVDDCRPWLDEVEGDIPRLVVEVKDDEGEPLAVTVYLDGDVRSNKTSRIVLPVDPGAHRLRLELAGHTPIERDVDAAAASDEIVVAMTMQAEPAAAAPPPGEPDTAPSVATWIVGGVGIVGLGMFVGFAASGLSRRGELDDARCAPRCPNADVDAMDRDFLIADISLGAGLGLLAVATVLFFATQSSSSGTALAIAPRVAGGELVMRGEF